MDLNLSFEELKCYSCVLDTVTRREETQETIVSDSMPDIGTVITATATPLLHSCKTGDGCVVCEGDVAAAAIYESEDHHAVFSIPITIPFRVQTDSAEVTGESRLSVSVRVAGVNVKIMNPRKILIQVEIMAHIRAFNADKLRYAVSLDAPEELGMQTKTESVSFQYLSQVTEKTFPFEETITFSAHRSIAQILSWESVPYCNETKLVGSKVVFKGGSRLKLRFLDADGGFGCEEFDLPLSQVLDAGASGEEALSMVTLANTKLDLVLLDQSNVSVEAEFYACGVLYDRRDVCVLCDAYSTRNTCSNTGCTQHGLRLKDLGATVVPFRQALESQLPSSEVVDQSILLADAALEEGSAGLVKCRFQVSICMRDRDGFLSHMDQTCYTDCSLSALQGDAAGVEVLLLDATCISAAGGLELRGSLMVRYVLSEPCCFDCLGGIALEETPPEQTCRRPSAVLRMLRDGESLWDLGKEYFATVDDILAVNQISDETAAAGKFLLIPRNR